jgi:hypothetical protein
MRQLLSQSPLQSETNLHRDLALLSKLTPAQNEALRDTSNGIVLTQKEKRALGSISPDQWHALSQMAAFYQWLNQRYQEAQAEAERQQQEAEAEAERQQQEAEYKQAQVEQEEDRTRLAIYQYLMAQAAARQANASAWQAAAAWRQQQCLSSLSRGLGCY